MGDQSWAVELQCDQSNRIRPGVGHGRNRLPQNRCCRCAYPSDVSGRDKTVHPRDDKLGSESGCHETDAANVLTLPMRMGGIRLCAQKSSDTIGGDRNPGKWRGGQRTWEWVRLLWDRRCGCAYPSDASGKDKTVCPKAIRYDWGG